MNVWEVAVLFWVFFVLFCFLLVEPLNTYLSVTTLSHELGAEINRFTLARYNRIIQNGFFVNPHKLVDYRSGGGVVVFI